MRRLFGVLSHREVMMGELLQEVVKVHREKQGHNKEVIQGKQGHNNRCMLIHTPGPHLMRRSSAATAEEILSAQGRGINLEIGQIGSVYLNGRKKR